MPLYTHLKSTEKERGETESWAMRFNSTVTKQTNKYMNLNEQGMWDMADAFCIESQFIILTDGI